MRLWFISLTDRRVYGVSHVQFSLNEKKREEEMKALFELSAKAERDRQTTKDEKRKKASEELAKANRLRARLGKEPLPGLTSLRLSASRKRAHSRAPRIGPHYDSSASG